MRIMDRVREVLRHQRNVEENTLLLGERLIEKGEVQFGIHLITRGRVHDVSKLSGIEFEYLDPKHPERDKMALAIEQHNRTNDHHPEFWGGIKYMPRHAIAEMVCDWKARSSEFGRSLFDWIEGDADYTAMKRFGFTKDDAIYALIMEFANLLCDQPFKPIKAQPT
jgi:hypothetical protein